VTLLVRSTSLPIMTGEKRICIPNMHYNRKRRRRQAKSGGGQRAKAMAAEESTNFISQKFLT